MRYVLLGLALLLSAPAFASNIDDMSWDEILNSYDYEVETVRINFRGHGTQKSIFSVCDDNGVLDGGEVSTTTGVDGSYEFLVTQGSLYNVRIVGQSGYVLTQPDPNSLDAWLIGTNDAAAFEGADFGLYDTSSIRGVVYLDANENGIRDGSEILLSGREVFLDSNGNGVRNVNEPGAVTGADGSCIFVDVEPGEFAVYVLGGNNPVDVLVASGSDIAGLELGAAPLGSISGVVYLDENLNGIQDNGESGLSGVLIFIDANLNGLYDLGEHNAGTDQEGNYTLTNVPVGTYQVVQTEFPGFNSGANRTVVLALDALEIVGVNFRNTFPGFVNGDFQIVDNTRDDFGWDIRGNAEVSGGAGILRSSGGLFSQLSQTFVVPENISSLRVTIISSHISFLTNGQLSDTFEVMLTYSSGGQLLASAADELTQTDSVSKLQPDMTLFFSDESYLGDEMESGDTLDLGTPVEVRIDLSDVAPGTRITVLFKLTGAGTASSVVVDDVQVVTGPPLAFDLDPSTDSGIQGSGVTNVTPVNLIGMTNAGQEVFLDLDGDGFDDGSVIADESGNFTFAGIALQVGDNTIRMQATDTDGTTTIFRILTLDLVAPVAVDDSATAITGDPTVLDLISNDTDADGTVVPGSVEIVEGPTNGTIAFDPETNELTYTSDGAFTGFDTFTYRVQDNGGNVSNIATVTIAVSNPENPINQAPAFVGGADQTVLENSGPHIVSGWATGITPGPIQELDQSVSFNVSVDRPELFAVGPFIDADGNLSYTLAEFSNGVATVTVVAVDNGGTGNGGNDTSIEQIFTITVLPVNQPPSFVAGETIVIRANSGPQTIANWATDISVGPANESDQTITWFIAISGDNILNNVSITEDGTLIFSPKDDVWGVATISVNAVDNGGDANGGSASSVNQVFTITVIPLNEAPTFVIGDDLEIPGDGNEVVIENWITGISAGPDYENDQTIEFVVSVDKPELFTSVPAIDANGTLRFATVSGTIDDVVISVFARDNGGTENGGVDTSLVQTANLSIVNAEPPTIFIGPGVEDPYWLQVNTLLEIPVTWTVGPGRTGVVTVSSGPPWTSVTGDGNFLTGVPLRGHPTVSDVWVTITDDLGATASASITIQLYRPWAVSARWLEELDFGPSRPSLFEWPESRAQDVPITAGRSG